MDNRENISFLKWLLSMFLYAIPIVNIIYTLVVIFKTDNETEKNWAKAALLMCVISSALNILIIVILKNIALASLFELYSRFIG